MSKIKQRAANKSEKIKVPAPVATTPDSNYPVFCFRYLIKGYAVEDCDRDNQSAFIKQLAMLSRTTWDAIRTSHRHGIGAEKINRDSINPTIPDWITADVKFFLAFRYNGKKPFVGHRREQVFHIFWIDHSYDVYDHGGS